MIFIITEEHSDTGRRNIMSGMAAAIKNHVYHSKAISIPRIFGDAPISDNKHPAVAGFKNAVGEFFQPQWCKSILREAKDALTPHLPRMTKDDIPVFITYCGHPDSVLTGLALKWLFPNTVLIGLGNPYRGLNYFDLIAALPFSDDLPENMKNVVQLDAFPSHITANMRMKAWKEWEKEFAAPRQLRVVEDDCFIALFVGGSYPFFAPDPREARVVGHAVFTPQHAHDLCARMLALKEQVASKKSKKTRVDFLISVSRRTPPEVAEIIYDTLGSYARWVYDTQEDTGPNPEVAMLVMAEYTVITGDSLSMISNALGTGTLSGAPVLVYAPESLIAHPLDMQRAHKRFCDILRTNGMIHFLGEPIRRQLFPFDHPADVIALHVRKILRKRKRSHTVRLATGRRAALG
jgi:mitochondrial fission protein ELM1